MKMISIVITSFREPKTIGKAMESFVNQDIEEKYELFVCAPDEETLNVARTYQMRNRNIKIFKDPGKGKAYALNLIFPKLKGEIIIFSDGDVYVSENSINEILKFFQNEKIGAVSGRPVAINGKNNMVDYFSNLLLDAGAHSVRLEFDKKNKFLECTGYLFAIRNNLIEKIPYLDTAEDSIIPYLIWKQGYKISYAPEAKVYVKYPSNLKDFVKQRKRAGVGSHSKLTKYYPDFPRMKSFTNEIKKGTISALQYPQNIKEFFWTLMLFPIRFYIWFIYYFEASFKKKFYGDAWERIESTK